MLHKRQGRASTTRDWSMMRPCYYMDGRFGKGKMTWRESVPWETTKRNRGRSDPLGIHSTHSRGRLITYLPCGFHHSPVESTSHENKGMNNQMLQWFKKYWATAPSTVLWRGTDDHELSIPRCNTNIYFPDMPVFQSEDFEITRPRMSKCALTSWRTWVYAGNTQRSQVAIRKETASDRRIMLRKGIQIVEMERSGAPKVKEKETDWWDPGPCFGGRSGTCSHSNLERGRGKARQTGCIRPACCRCNVAGMRNLLPSPLLLRIIISVSHILFGKCATLRMVLESPQSVHHWANRDLD